MVSSKIILRSAGNRSTGKPKRQFLGWSKFQYKGQSKGQSKGRSKGQSQSKGQSKGQLKGQS